VATVDDTITYKGMLNAQLTISEEVNPNTLAQGLLLAYLIIYTVAVSVRKWWLLIFAVLPIVPMMMIGSRTAFITLVVISILVLLFDSRISKKLKTLILLLTLLCIPTILNYANQFNERLDVDSIVEDDGSGRFDTWSMLVDNVIPNNPIMGVGYGRVNLERVGYAVDADNFYVDALSQIGAIGLLLLVLMLIFYLKPLWGKQDVNSRLALSLLLFIPIAGFGETIFDTFIFVFILLYAALARECVIREKYRYDEL
jgi:O-antigen ligase